MLSSNIETPKGTSSRQNASFKLHFVLLRRPIWAVRTPEKLDGYKKSKGTLYFTVHKHVHVQVHRRHLTADCNCFWPIKRSRQQINSAKFHLNRCIRLGFTRRHLHVFIEKANGLYHSAKRYRANK
jgi:hypothetical protein